MQPTEQIPPASTATENIDLIGFGVCMVSMIAFFAQVATYTDLLSQIF